MSLLALLPGCDVISEFLGLGGGEEEEKPEQPDGPSIPTGGTSHILTDDDGTWAVHVFTESGTLTFPDGWGPVTADYLIVAGGGGAGGTNSPNLDSGGGGGAGGLLYQTDQTLPLEDGSVSIIVGAGGTGGGTTNGTGGSTNSGNAGGDGGKSAIGTVEAPGGGGGGGAMSNMNGRPGGSGGGSGAGSGTEKGEKGTPPAANGVLGSAGGMGGDSGGTDPGGGGGGACGTGGDATGDSDSTAAVAGKGGLGWKPSEKGAAWVKVVTNTDAFSCGGIGGKQGVANNPPAANYGDGGAASSEDTNGRSGIVVIRFPYIAP